MLGDSHLRGSELSAKCKLFGVIRPRAGAEKIVNSSAEDLQSLHIQNVIVFNSAANDVYKNNKRVA
jgi:hypothetical protein